MSKITGISFLPDCDGTILRRLCSRQTKRAEQFPPVLLFEIVNHEFLTGLWIAQHPQDTFVHDLVPVRRRRRKLVCEPSVSMRHAPE